MEPNENQIIRLKACVLMYEVGIDALTAYLAPSGSNKEDTREMCRTLALKNLVGMLEELTGRPAEWCMDLALNRMDLLEDGIDWFFRQEAEP